MYRLMRVLIGRKNVVRTSISEINEKNLFKIIMSSMIGPELFCIIFSIVIVLLYFLAEGIEKRSDIVYALAFVLGIVFLIFIDTSYRLIKLKGRIRYINKSKNIDIFKILQDKELKKNHSYVDEEWFIAVPSPELLILCKNDYKNEIDISDRRRYMTITLYTNSGKIERYDVDYKWDGIVRKLKKWIEKER